MPRSHARTARLCRNIRGKWTLGWYDSSVHPPRYEQRIAPRFALLMLARNMGFTHLFLDHDRVAVSLHEVR